MGAASCRTTEEYKARGPCELKAVVRPLKERTVSWIVDGEDVDYASCVSAQHCTPAATRDVDVMRAA